MQNGIINYKYVLNFSNPFFSKTKRDISITVSSRGFYETGFYPDVIQHALFLILATSHVRFHWSLRVYEEERIKYKFKVKLKIFF